MNNDKYKPEFLTPVVVLCGVSGSGKTYYARTLQQKGYVRLSLDEIVWREYSGRLSSMSGEEQKKVFAQASAALGPCLASMLDRGERVVVDSTMCRRSKRDAIREVCRSRGIEPLLIYMQASLPLLKKRLATRKGLGPDDQIVPPRLIEMFYANFEAPAPDEEFTVICQNV